MALKDKRLVEWHELQEIVTSPCQVWGDIDPSTNYLKILKSQEETSENWEKICEIEDWYRTKGIKILQQEWKSYQLEKSQKLTNE